MKNQLKKRMVYLWTFELFNAVIVFPGVYLSISRNVRLGWFSLVALGVVCAILVIGAIFWFLKWRALSGSQRLYQPSTRRFFRACKSGFALVLPVLFILLAVRACGHVPFAELFVGGLLSIMALLEYINYYVVQLSYDNRADLRYLLTVRRLKKAVMVRELTI
jgi:hypothetical protein